MIQIQNYAQVEEATEEFRLMLVRALARGARVDLHLWRYKPGRRKEIKVTITDPITQEKPACSRNT